MQVGMYVDQLIPAWLLDLTKTLITSIRLFILQGYISDWHGPFISNRPAKALERLSEVRGQIFYGRAVLSVGAAQAINGALFFGIAFGGVMPIPAILSAACFS